MDFVAAFDWLVLSWVWLVLGKLGVDPSVINRVKGLYEDSITITVVNNQLGRVFHDRRGSLRQGGCASMEWFSFGIDPLLRYLERRLQGILISSLPVLGPSPKDESHPLPPLEERLRYCDDAKPVITAMAEFTNVDRVCTPYEKSSDCELHPYPALEKCKLMKLGSWRYASQIHGTELKATWQQTRKAIDDIIQTRVSNTVNAWKYRKFMETLVPEQNSYALPKARFRCHSVNMRIADITSITNSTKLVPQYFVQSVCSDR